MGLQRNTQSARTHLVLSDRLAELVRDLVEHALVVLGRDDGPEPAEEARARLGKLDPGHSLQAE
jgi:hypothetical protein